MEITPIESLDSLDMTPLNPSSSTQRVGALAPWYEDQEVCNAIFRSKEFLKFREKDYASPFSMQKQDDGSYLIESEHGSLRIYIEREQNPQGFCGRSSYTLRFEETITPSQAAYPKEQNVLAPWYNDSAICDLITQNEKFREFREKDYASSFTMRKEDDGSYTLESLHYRLRVEVQAKSDSYNLEFSLQGK